MKAVQTTISVFGSFLPLIFSMHTNAQIVNGFLAMSSLKNTPIITNINLNVVQTSNGGEITWNNPGEIPVRRFEVEKSNNATTYQYLTAIAGNTAANNSYKVNDDNVTEGTNYYRLKIVDGEGSIGYSNTVSIEVNHKMAQIKIAPFVAQNQLQIWLPANTRVTHAVITNAYGQEFKESNNINNMSNLASVTVSGLPSGIYNINILTNNGLAANLKFSKK